MDSRVPKQQRSESKQTRSTQGIRSASLTDSDHRSTLFIGSVEKAFKVLQAFNGPRRHMTLADICRATGQDRSATQRLTHTLVELGYLRRISETRNTGLAPRLLPSSYNTIRHHDLKAKTGR